MGAPPEVLARLTAVAQDLELRQRTALGSLGTATEPELDQFMVRQPINLGTFFLGCVASTHMR